MRVGIAVTTAWNKTLDVESAISDFGQGMGELRVITSLDVADEDSIEYAIFEFEPEENTFYVLVHENKVVSFMKKGYDEDEKQN